MISALNFHLEVLGTSPVIVLRFSLPRSLLPLSEGKESYLYGEYRLMDASELKRAWAPSTSELRVLIVIKSNTADAIMDT